MSDDAILQVPAMPIKRFRLLDLFCGAGGCAVGYHRAGFTEIVGVDNRPMPRYPFAFVQADALEYLAEHGAEFDAIHASPPCQAYCSMTRSLNRHLAGSYPDLLGPTREALVKKGQPWIIENVPGSPIRNAILLCGSMFRLKTTTKLHGEVWLKRHRVFESNTFLFAPGPCRCNKKPKVPVYGNGAGGIKHSRMKGKGVAQASREVMGIDWMLRTELDQAIPPAYTEFIGKQLLDHLRHRTDTVSVPAAPDLPAGADPGPH